MKYSYAFFFLITYELIYCQSMLYYLFVKSRYQVPKTMFTYLTSIGKQKRVGGLFLLSKPNGPISGSQWTLLPFLWRVELTHYFNCCICWHPSSSKLSNTNVYHISSKSSNLSPLFVPPIPFLDLQINTPRPTESRHLSFFVAMKSHPS